ncbi:MAG: hypothetical protein FJ303_15435 [Planctomycetes bacterium]|nr:hypothetical protein [Planctomycetota bacterium]
MFQRVEPQHAGPNALGILVPAGARTPVVVRPRGLEWDLLPARWDGDTGKAPQFCAFGRDDAVNVARRFLAALEAAVATGVCPVQTFGDPGGKRVQVWLRTDTLVWIVCSRTPGMAYRPKLFATLDEATCEAERIAAVVWPAVDAVQEYYFNTQGFS